MKPISPVSRNVNLYIGMAEHEGDIPSDQVTLSIFRAAKPEKLFREMAKQGHLTEDATKGIYHVEGIIDLPFHIVITSELEGPEYAAYRALTDHASEVDVEQVIRNGSRETDSAMRDHYRVFLDLVVRKNPDVIEEIRRDKAMAAVWMDILKDEIDEKMNAREQDTRVLDILNVMESLQVNSEKAMDALNIPQNQRSTYAGLVKRV